MNPFETLFCRAYQLVFRAALPLLPYRKPVELTSLSAIPPLLAEKGVGSVLLVTDRGVRSLGLTAPLETALAAQGIVCTVYDGVVQNPTIDNVEAGRALYLSSGAQAIIAVGGGSAMDCAKAVGARIARPNRSVQKMKGLLRVLRRTPLLIAAPTTAGTGSETTLAAVITDARAHHKYPINDFALIPDYAVLDPQLTAGLPPQLTATTGMDALTHAVEAYIGRSTTKLTRAMAEKAVCLIHDNLLVAYQDGGNMQARANMLEAAYCAGIAFTRSYVGYVHGVAHSLGGQYGVPHGLANAVILPYFLDVYGESAEKKLAKLSRLCGVSAQSDGDAQATKAFIAWIRGMNEAMRIPASIPEIREADIPQMARHAARESNPLYPVPRLMNARELEPMYRRLMSKEAQA